MVYVGIYFEGLCRVITFNKVVLNKLKFKTYFIRIVMQKGR